MPEGPEVSLISKALNSQFSGKIIHDICIHKDSKYRSESPFIFKEALGKKLLSVTFKGKKIIFVLEHNCFLLSSLGLEGKWLNVSPIPDSPHLSITIEFLDGKILAFYDQRHFGSFEYCKSREILDLKLLSVGIPWISSSMFKHTVTKNEFYNMLRNTRLKNKKIMLFLMDQKYTAGVGNYIRSEALYFSGISPHRLINTITREESDLLHESIVYVMEESIKAGGHTLRSYTDTEGTKGGYVPEIYGRLNTLSENEKIFREKDSQGRSIFWVPKVQL